MREWALLHQLHKGNGTRAGSAAAVPTGCAVPDHPSEIHLIHKPTVCELGKESSRYSLDLHPMCKLKYHLGK